MMAGPGPGCFVLRVLAIVCAMAGTPQQMRIGGALGELVSGLAEYEQTLRLVVETPESSIPGRPTFGSRCHEALDMPLPQASAFLVAEVARAIGVNAPRITVLGVTTSSGDLGNLVVEIAWQPTKPLSADDAQTQKTKVILGRAA